MGKIAAKKFSSVMSKPLLERLKKEADHNGQSLRFVLEKAVQHYLDVVVPSSRTVRSDIVAFAEQTIAEYDELLRRLAKAK